MKFLCTAALMLFGLGWLPGQAVDTFPEYTPDKISDIRNEFSRQGRYEEGIKYLRSWEAHEGAPVRST